MARDCKTVGGNSMSHWCWHSFPLPERRQQGRRQTPGDQGQRQVEKRRHHAAPQPLRDWQRDNPHPLNLGRIGFIDQTGARLNANDVRMISRASTSGPVFSPSTFEYLGETVTVETCVDPETDAVRRPE